jgi:hypothetical protein
MTRRELTALTVSQAQKIAVLQRTIRTLEDDLREEHDEREFEAKENLELSQQLELSAVDPAELARAVHEFLLDRGGLPGGLPWKASTTDWQRDLTALFEGFSYPGGLHQGIRVMPPRKATRPALDDDTEVGANY